MERYVTSGSKLRRHQHRFTKNINVINVRHQGPMTSLRKYYIRGLLKIKI